jgi:hypothetical protein
MDNNQQIELRNAHTMGIKGIFSKYIWSKILNSTGTAICASAVLVFLIFVICPCRTNEYYFNLLDEITNLLLSLLPNLLGFCIGGYALIIGACNLDIIKKMSMPYSEKHEYSFYQIVSAVFASTLVCQCITLIIVYIVHIIIKMDIPPISNFIGKITNISVISLILFLSGISLSLLYYTIVNIFSFGQTIHFCVRKENVDQSSNKKEGNKINNKNE